MFFTQTKILKSHNEKTLFFAYFYVNQARNQKVEHNNGTKFVLIETKINNYVLMFFLLNQKTPQF